MKKNNDTPTLEQLLQSIEHAGRDHRRQQQLAQMIDQMADAEQSRRRTVRLWSARLAVAASITLFVVVPVWKWIDSSQPAGPQLAEAFPLRHGRLPVPRPVSPVSASPAPNRALRPAALQLASLSDTAAPSADNSVSQPVLPAEVEILAVEPILFSEADIAEIALADPLPDIADSAVETFDFQPVLPQPQPDQIAEVPAEPRRQSFFSFLNAEPSLMDGTMLAFNIL